LDGLNAGEAFVDVHAAKERLVEAGLKFIGGEKDGVFVGFESFTDVAAAKTGG
jgi:hypothetical protein